MQTGEEFPSGTGSLADDRPGCLFEDPFERRSESRGQGTDSHFRSLKEAPSGRKFGQHLLLCFVIPRKIVTILNRGNHIVDLLKGPLLLRGVVPQGDHTISRRNAAAACSYQRRFEPVKRLPFQLAVTLQGVLSQNLVAKVGGGRALALEVMIASPAIRNLIREGKVHQIYSAMQAGGRYGMQTMDMSIAAHVKAGRINQQVAFERCHDPEELQRLVGGASAAPMDGGGAMAMGSMMGGGDYV